MMNNYTSNKVFHFQITSVVVELSIEVLPEGSLVHRHTSLLLDLRNRAHVLRLLNVIVDETPIIPYEVPTAFSLLIMQIGSLSDYNPSGFWILTLANRMHVISIHANNQNRKLLGLGKVRYNFLYLIIRQLSGLSPQKIELTVITGKVQGPFCHLNVRKILQFP